MGISGIDGNSGYDAYSGYDNGSNGNATDSANGTGSANSTSGSDQQQELIELFKELIAMLEGQSSSDDDSDPSSDNQSYAPKENERAESGGSQGGGSGSGSGSGGSGSGASGVAPVAESKAVAEPSDTASTGSTASSTASSTSSTAVAGNGSTIPGSETGAQATNSDEVKTVGDMQGATQYYNVTNNSNQAIYEQFTDTNGDKVTDKIGAGDTGTFETGATLPGERIDQVDSSGNELDPGKEALFEDATTNGVHEGDVSDVDTGMSSEGVAGSTNDPNQAITVTTGNDVSYGNAYQGTGHGAYLDSNDDAVLNSDDGGKLDPMVGADDTTNTINISVTPNTSDMTNGPGVPTGSDAPI